MDLRLLSLNPGTVSVGRPINPAAVPIPGRAVPELLDNPNDRDNLRVIVDALTGGSCYNKIDVEAGECAHYYDEDDAEPVKGPRYCTCLAEARRVLDALASAGRLKSRQ